MLLLLASITAATNLRPSRKSWPLKRISRNPSQWAMEGIAISIMVSVNFSINRVYDKSSTALGPWLMVARSTGSFSTSGVFAREPDRLRLRVLPRLLFFELFERDLPFLDPLLLPLLLPFADAAFLPPFFEPFFEPFFFGGMVKQKPLCREFELTCCKTCAYLLSLPPNNTSSSR